MPCMRVGISGLGSIGRRHLGTLGDLPGVEVVAAADPRAAATGEMLPGGIALFGDFDEMIEAVGLDVVVLCTPSFLHAEQAVSAARRGMHVVVEKPMAITLPSADDLLATCAEHDVRLAVLHQYRYHESVVRLRSILGEGRLGDLVFLTIHVNWRRDRAYYEGSGSWRGTWAGDGGGALMNQGSHAVDLARWLGGPIARVSAHTTNVCHDIEAEDTVVAGMEFVDGGLGTLQVTTCAARNQPLTLRLEGTKGAALMVGPTLTVDGEVVVDERPGAADKTQAHRCQFTEIFSSLAAGGVPPVAGHDARATLAATFAMYEAARTRQPVVVS